jgi:hypothetical protein
MKLAPVSFHFATGLTCPENAELQVARNIFIMVA